MWPLIYGGAGAISLLCGLLMIIFPRPFWRFRYGWMYQNAKPSKLGLSAARARGVIGLLVSAGFFVIAYLMWKSK